MSDNSTTSSVGTTQGREDVPIHTLLGFEAGDHVSLATDGVKVARTFEAADLSFDYAVHQGRLSAQDTWIGAQPVKKSLGNKRAKASDVACVRVLYADFDFKDSNNLDVLTVVIDELSEILGAEPISIVHSGGGMHPRWKLEEPLDTSDSVGVLNRWKLTVMRVCESYGFKPDSVFDLPRVLRMPGTVNTKYDPPRPVTITPRSLGDRVATRTLWTNLDTKVTAENRRAERAALDTSPLTLEEGQARDTPAPPRPERVDTLSERAVNVAIRQELDILDRLTVEGWDGKPWHATTRDVAFRLAKIAQSPETPHTEAELWEMFERHAPRDDEDFDDEKIAQLWESALEKAEGEVFELIGAGDELFADDLDEMLTAAAESSRIQVDIDPALSFDDEPRPAGEPAPASDLPLIPGFGGRSALRGLELDDPLSPAIKRRIKVYGEDIADLHADEHREYAHPHCPHCFPSTWQEQLFRWLVRNPSGDPTQIRPPLGRLAPGEGYMPGSAALELPDSEMLISGYLPANSIGLITGRGHTGKTYLALDIAMHVLDPQKSIWEPGFLAATDGSGVVDEHGGVLFLAGEGLLGLKGRIRSWLAHNGYTSVPDWIDDLTVRGDVPNMFDAGQDFEKLLERVVVDRPKLIIIDTLQKATAGADQNAASDMGVVHNSLLQLRTAAGGATILVIAHTDKSDSSTRGSSSIEDDSDFILHVKRGREGSVDLEIDKMRDGEPAAPLTFYIKSVGKSAVVSSTPGAEERGAAVTQETIELMTALHEVHAATDFNEPVKWSDLKAQVRTLTQADIMRTARSLIHEGLIISSGNKNYKLTTAGVAWIESKDSRLFAASKGVG